MPDLAEAIAVCARRGESVCLRAGGSKSCLGRPVEATHVLDLSALDGIIEYDHAELVLTAKAATPMRVIAEGLAKHRQMLAFEPPDWSALLPGAGEATLGGTIACNVAGPRRVRAGAPRDHFLGFSAIDGRGETWKAGGRVVKNVSGYDMAKLQAGAYGTLSVLTEVTLRLLPRPETSLSVALSGLSEADAVVAMAAALNSPHEVSAAAHLPPGGARRCSAALPEASLTVLRLEGPAPSVRARAEALRTLLGGTDFLEEADSVSLWKSIGGVQSLFAAADDAIVWRLHPVPSSAAALLAELRTALPGCEGFLDWGGGLIWLALGPEDAAEPIVRGAMARAGGHAMLFRAPAALRAGAAVFQPEPPALAALTRRIKLAADPCGVLNPGRMRAGV